jgi:hypothetical protein
MNGKNTPLAEVNEVHGGKTKLVDKIISLIEIGDEDRDSLRGRLAKASNRKLLRLLAISGAIRDKYGSPGKMAQAVAEKLNRAKDADYVRKLESLTPARLLDVARSLAREARRPLKLSSAKKPEKPAPPAAAKRKTPAKGAKPAGKGRATAKKPASKPAARAKTAKKGAPRKSKG